MATPMNNTPPQPPRTVVVAENIPGDMQAIPSWVAWRWFFRDGSKWTKRLLCPNSGIWASSTDPKTWGTFECALKYYEKHVATADGIGYVVSDSDPYSGIDLDHHRDRKTGELDTLAREIFQVLDSYSEVSPSQDGTKTFVRGKMPDGSRCRESQKNAEIYSRERFFTVTGNRLPSFSATVEERQTELEKIHSQIFPSKPKPAPSARPISGGHGLSDLELVERASGAKNGEKFRRLWAGDTSEYGSHSEADQALCNLLAFWTGGDAARIDAMFRQAGLYREKWEREDYRATTISKALEGRTDFFSPPAPRTIFTLGGRVLEPFNNGRQSTNGDGAAHVAGNGDSGDSGVGKPPRPAPSPIDQGGFSNFFEAEIPAGGGKTKIVKTGYPAPLLWRSLSALTGNWPKTIGKIPFVEDRDSAPLWIEKPDALFAWIARFLKEGQINRLRWGAGPNLVTQGQFFAFAQQNAENFDALERLPHHPPMPKTYYLHSPVEGGDGKALDWLLGRFCPSQKSNGVDRDLVLAFILSVFWGGPCGQRPAWLFTGEEGDSHAGRGVGKTTLAGIIAYLVGGAIHLSPGDPADMIMTRLLSPAALGKRIAIIDNIKTLRFSWAELESLVTADVISGRQLYTGEGRRPNSLTWVLTLNGASLSRDMAQRSIVIKLARPEHSSDWETETKAFIDSHRMAIAGDILAILRRPAPKLDRHGRWGLWESQVLARVGDPGECQKVIEERQKECDDDQAEGNIVRQGFRAELLQRGHLPDAQIVWMPALVAAEITNVATGEKRPVGRASVYLGTLGIKELQKSDKGAARGWKWVGKDAN